MVKSLVRKEESKKKEKVVKFIKEKRKRTNILKKKPARTNSWEICKVVKLKRYQTSKKNINWMPVLRNLPNSSSYVKYTKEIH